MDSALRQDKNGGRKPQRPISIMVMPMERWGKDQGRYLVVLLLLPEQPPFHDGAVEANFQPLHCIRA